MDVSRLKKSGRFYKYEATNGEEMITVLAVPVTNKSEWDFICGHAGKSPKVGGKYGWMFTLYPISAKPLTTYVSTATSLNTGRLRESFNTVMSDGKLKLLTEILSYITKISCNVPTAELGYA